MSFFGGEGAALGFLPTSCGSSISPLLQPGVQSCLHEASLSIDAGQ